jgi:hypothetical protein
MFPFPILVSLKAKPMLHHTTGNLLAAPTQSLVNAVNTQGVMGKGILSALSPQ